MVSASAAEPEDREFPSQVVFVLCFCYNLLCKLAASSSHGDFEACVNLLQTCFTLALLSCQACRSAVQVCFKLKLLSGLQVLPRQRKSTKNLSI
ncbi:hypothetical protein AVEN_111363-1 [Araneus ventricosus]|uniref:Uncharacterized protein n=1 Tax=Araneus ventricosus TaxID=182803 RepID=A0A4Y2MJY5_ARAVE|nr:hypothetical protein AVEN_111363-1 [Araneus ventricosus]